MPFILRPDPIDYLLIGHITCDLTPDGPKLGGTAAYAALTAHAMGLRVGVVTSWGIEIPSGPLSQISISNTPTDNSTTFENIYTPEGHIQIVHHVAPSLDFDMITESWRNAPIVHLGPIAREVAPTLARRFPNSLVGVTPQGWLRTWDGNGRFQPSKWQPSRQHAPALREYQMPKKCKTPLKLCPNNDASCFYTRISRTLAPRSGREPAGARRPAVTRAGVPRIFALHRASTVSVTSCSSG